MKRSVRLALASLAVVFLALLLDARTSAAQNPKAVVEFLEFLKLFSKPKPIPVTKPPALSPSEMKRLADELATAHPELQMEIEQGKQGAQPQPGRPEFQKLSPADRMLESETSLPPALLKAIHEAAERTARRALESEARAALRVKVERLWPETATRDGSTVTVDLEAKGMTKEEIENVFEALRAPLVKDRPKAAAGIRVTEVNLPEAKLTLSDGERTYLIGFKPLKRVIAVGIYAIAGGLAGAGFYAVCGGDEAAAQPPGGPTAGRSASQSCAFLEVAAGLLGITLHGTQAQNYRVETTL